MSTAIVILVPEDRGIMPDGSWQITRLLVSKGLVNAPGAVVAIEYELFDIDCIVAVPRPAELTIHVNLIAFGD